MSKSTVAQSCRFDFRGGDPGRLQCQVHADHVLYPYVDRAGRLALLRGLRDRGELVGEAEREAAMIESDVT